MTQDAKSAEWERLAAALRANLRRRKAATRQVKFGLKRGDGETDEPPRPDAAADRESKG